MDDLTPPPVLAEARERFDALVRDIRVELHRYCARMVGSAVDGEDIVQDALARAYYLLPTMHSVANLRGWLFRIAHNRAIDFLRRYDRRYAEPLGDHAEPVQQPPPLEAEELARLALSHYMKLTPVQRSCVILKDVMGDSLVEISEVLDISVPAIKGALHRGRTALREAAGEAREERPAALDPDETRMLEAYVDRFNAREFDALRDLLVDDARLELVGRTQRRGARDVGEYFGNYDRIRGWRVAAGRVDGRPAVLGYDGADAAAGGDIAPAGRPSFFIPLEWRGGRIASIRDFRYARHVAELARIEPIT